MKLTQKQLKQMIKEELRLVMENEHDEKMLDNIRKVFKSPMAVRGAESLLGSFYKEKLKFKLFPNKVEEEGGEIYSDDLETMEALKRALTDFDHAEMSEPMDLSEMKGFTKACKDSYKYMAYYYFNNQET